MLADCLFNETRWRSQGSSGTKEIKSVENRIRCLANFKFISQTTWHFEEHDQLADVYISSVGNVSWRIALLLDKGLVLFQHLVGYGHPKKLEIRGYKMLNCERSIGPFSQVACFAFLFTFPANSNFKFQPGLKLIM